jgi:VanZ family protein
MRASDPATAALRALAPLALMALIFGLSSISTLDSGLGTVDFVLRKLTHMAEYLLLTLLWAWTLGPLSARASLFAALISIAYAASDEFHQSFVPGRTGTPRDLIFDGFGVLLALLLLRYHRRVRAAALGEAPGSDR